MKSRTFFVTLAIISILILPTGALVLAFSSGGPAGAFNCPSTSGNSYLQGAVRQWDADNPVRPAWNHADKNLPDLRGYSATEAPKTLVDLRSDDPTQPPQLATLFNPDRTPIFSNVYRANQWIWGPPPPTPGTRGGPITDWPVTVLGLQTFTGEVLRVPTSGYDIGGDQEVIVMFADSDTITFKYTREDSVAPSGYTLHVDNICIDPNLLALYNQRDATAGPRYVYYGPHDGNTDYDLPTLPAGKMFGVARDTEVRVAIVDTGAFQDPRSMNEWWQIRGTSPIPRPPGDFEGDGKTDVAAHYTGASQVWWRNSINGTWDGVWIDPSSPYALIKGSDFDGDARTDIAVHYTSLSRVSWRSSITGVWSNIAIAPSAPYTLVPRSDFDGDGKTDVAAYYPSLSQVWWRNSSTGTWEGVWITPSPSYTLVIGSDFDGDGKTDVAAYYESLSQVWWRNSSTGAWQGVWIYPTPSYTLVSGADFDEDGRTDVAAYYPGLSQVWWRNSSSGTWEGVWIYPTPSYTLLTDGDYDGDGKPDLAAYYSSLSQVWWRNSSSGTWTGVWIDSSSPYQLVRDVDFDGDGRTDVAAYYAGSSQVWWRNSSTGTWSGVWVDSSSAYTLVTGSQ